VSHDSGTVSFRQDVWRQGHTPCAFGSCDNGFDHERYEHNIFRGYRLIRVRIVGVVLVFLAPSALYRKISDWPESF